MEIVHLGSTRRSFRRKASTPFVTAVKFLYLETLEMPWGSEQFPRVRRAHKLPVVLSHEEVIQFFDHVPSLKYRAAFMTCTAPACAFPRRCR